jgi:hypothetical protein
MKKTLPYHYLLLLSILVTAFGCNKPPEYPVEPHIEFKSIESYPLVSRQGGRYDSLVIVTRFEDGDGDLGLSSLDEQVPPFNEGSNGVNYLLETFVKRQGDAGFEKIDLLGINGRFFRLSSDSRIGPLEGDLRYSYKVPTPNIFNIKTGDQIRFRIQIRDRALHFSNIVESEVHTINFP